MSVSKRKFLKLVGGGVIVAASASAGMFLTTRTPEKALAPWKQAGTYEEPRRRALSFAILAPNPHNRQPWLVDLSQNEQITLFVDTERLLPHTDPFNRQITIGLGCFLELLRMGAAEDGYSAIIEAFPEGHDNTQLDKRPVAVISFKKDKTVQSDPLFVNVLERRSLKLPYDLNQKVADSVLKELKGVVQNNMKVGVTNQPQRISQLRQLTFEAMMVETVTERTYRESVDLFRIGKAEINATPDGIDLGGPLLDSLGAAGIFTRETVLDTSSDIYQQGIDRLAANTNTAMGYIWLISRTNTRIDQLNAGKDWLRINLAATASDIGLHPMSQPLQEYAEMADLFAQTHKILGGRGGHGSNVGPLGICFKDCSQAPLAVGRKNYEGMIIWKSKKLHSIFRCLQK